jgi:hypothetical protein
VGFNIATHVAPAPLPVVRSELILGWDSAPNAHTHALVIGARLGPEVRVYAGLVAEETGLEQFLEAYVVPWFARRAAWALKAAGGLFHYYDPAMNPAEGGDVEQSALRRIRRALGGGTFHAGPQKWAPRAGALLALLNMSNGRGGMALQIDPGPDCAQLVRAAAYEWHYATTRAGTVVRDLPAKPNHPAEDLGDSLAYFACGVAPSREPRDRNWKPAPSKTDFNLADFVGRRAATGPMRRAEDRPRRDDGLARRAGW